MQQVRWAHLSVTARVGNTIPFQELSQQWRAVGKTVSNLTGLRFEHHPSRPRDRNSLQRQTRYRLTNWPVSFHSYCGNMTPLRSVSLRKMAIGVFYLLGSLLNTNLILTKKNVNEKCADKLCSFLFGSC